MNGLYRTFGRILLFAAALGYLPASNSLAAERPESASEATRPAALARALDRLVNRPDGPPGAIVIIQRGNKRQVFAAGDAVACKNPDKRHCGRARPPRPGDAMRIASVSKTFSGAAALALVSDGALALDDTIGDVLPDLPADWHSVKLSELLNHTSGVPDFANSPAFGAAIAASPHKAPPPRVLLSFVEDKGLVFTPGSAYAYSNSDNIIVGLMVEAASGNPYTTMLRKKVYKPLRLKRTQLKNRSRMPKPFIHGYGIAEDGSLEDVSTEIAFGGYAWASGGIVSTPADLSRFVRGYVGGALFGKAARDAQFTFRNGDASSPPGPGKNAAGLALFRYKTRCGTVYGHTGSILGYTQLIAASSNGRKSVTFSINTQAGDSLIPALRRAQVKAVCLALGK
jgi:D-alanyl-D-alanine carboxypeptidase